MLREVGAILFHSQDPLKLVAFYRDVLGLEVSFGGAEFRAGNLRLGVWGQREIQGPARDPDRVIVNFLVQDVSAVHEKLKGKGVELIKPPTDEDWGGKSVTLATFRDPDGNRLQLLQFKK